MNLIWEVSWAEFLFVTVILAGSAAVMTGRAVAVTWGSWLTLAIYIALLCLATRFIHYALFGGTFLLPPSDFPVAIYYYFIDFVVLMIIAGTARQMTRARQMGEQYSFLYDRSGPFGWRRKA
ncbi:DUF6867 family protein [Afifella pfennigii]|uniref:DUF6867 family protein n=1 Tax=Afifella pfennigii TaxID=209897 RepID=UPI00047E6A56|nr:hypothetical protein [Afifella pfennigii]